MKGPNDPITPKELKSLKETKWYHDPLCPESIGDGECVCIVLYLKRALVTIEKLTKKSRRIS
jgi:hypothetical protein